MQLALYNSLLFLFILPEKRLKSTGECTDKHLFKLKYTLIFAETYTILPKLLGHPLLMKGLTTLVISISTNINV